MSVWALTPPRCREDRLDSVSMTTRRQSRAVVVAERRTDVANVGSVKPHPFKVVSKD